MDVEIARIPPTMSVEGETSGSRPTERAGDGVSPVSGIPEYDLGARSLKYQ